MSSAHIVANQAGKPAGQSSVSRRDLDLAVPVFLSNANDDGVRSHRWSMVDRPSSSTAVITNKASAVCQFTPDVPGSYLVELQVDEAREGQVDRRVFAVLTDFGGLSPRPLRIPASGEDDEANWLYDFGVTTTPNTRGWQPDFVELVLYAGILAGPAPALSAVLGAGNTTGAHDIVMSATAVLRGAPGQPVTIVGVNVVETASALHSSTGATVTRESTTNGITDTSFTTYTLNANDDILIASGTSVELTADALTLNASADVAIVASSLLVTALGIVSLETTDVVLPTDLAVVRGEDGIKPTGFTVRGGSGVGTNIPGEPLTLRGGDSTGTGAGTSLILSPGGVVSGARGRVLFAHLGPDTDKVTETASLGTNGAASATYVGTQNPGAAAVSASCGDLYLRDSGSVGEAYIKSAGNANGTGWHRLGNITLFARNPVAQTVSGTTVETTIVSFTVPGNSMGTNGTVRLTVAGTFVASAIATTFTLRIKFGGTTIYQDVSPSIGVSATLRAWSIDVHIVNANSASSQTGGGEVSVSAASAATTGVGALAAALTGGPVRLGSSAIDTTADQALLVTVAHSSNSASSSTVRTFAVATVSMH